MSVPFNEFPHVFSPVKIGPITLKNRLQFSPMVSAHASLHEGYVTEELVRWLGAEAKSGAGLVTIGSSPVNFDRGRDFLGCLSVTRDEDVFPLKALAYEVHRYGAKISCELIHAGRAARSKYFPDWGAYVPSIVPDLNPTQTFLEIPKEELPNVVQDFANAARRLKEAGFDMVMIHGAHGNLLSGFMSARTNKRTDEYGGSLENRCRLALEVCKAVREAVGPNVAIEYRISSYEYLEGSPTLDDLVWFLRQAQQYIDLVNLSGGLLPDPVISRFMMPSYAVPRCINVERTAYIRERIDIPVTAVGNIPDIYTAEQILAEGKADVVAMARNIIADMDLVNKAWRGEADDIRACLHCNICCTTPGKGGQVRCAVNPQAGREIRYAEIQKAPEKKKVMIVGGGVAGLQAAQTAKARGHEVVLYERDEELGGRLHEASAMWCKDYFRRYMAWTVRHGQESCDRLELGVEVTPEIVEKEAPDALIIAIGADNSVPPIPGIKGDNVITVSQADLRQAEIGKRVVMCGGGSSGTECALDLAHDGHEVTIVDGLSGDVLMMELANETRQALIALRNELGVELIDEAMVKEITPEGVIITKDGEERLLEADTVVTSFGMKSRTAAAEALCGIIPETYVVGDAREVRNIFWANRDAFDVAVEI